MLASVIGSLTPSGWHTIALVLGAILGTFSRLWATPSFDIFSRQLVVELIGNGVAAILIPYVGVVFPSFDITKMPAIANFAVMYFIASGSGDFLGNVRRKVAELTGGATPPVPPSQGKG